MSLRGEWRRLRELDWRELDLAESGGWPWSLQLLCCLLLLGLSFFGTRLYLAAPVAETLDQARAEEAQLREAYRRQAARAANLAVMREQMAELDARMARLKAMLPSGAEIPALLDSISGIAGDHRLAIEAVRLRESEPRAFYTERPFDIRVRGSYHRIAAFLADIAALPRIVTLHDFTLTPAETGEELVLSLLARTYSYRGAPAEDEAAGNTEEAAP